ncbi:hypothetical protein [Pandoravirus japonicus]|uniref:Uncharacterized protein n=1 Tax=Pandoravirus japonicus TaxID=2823154 RepID=A0A811BMV1_9VIRU|nr:hypothetical protein [Pandoravirus japonicus]
MQTAATQPMPSSSADLLASGTPPADTSAVSSMASAPEPAVADDGRIDPAPSDAAAQTDYAVTVAIHGATDDNDDNDRDGIDDDSDSGEEEEGMDRNDSDSDTTGAVPPRAPEESTGADSVQAANVAGTSRLVGRKRPRDAAAVAQPMRKRHYVDSVRAVDGVRRHVSVTCTRLAVGGFKCTFTSEHRRLNSALRSQRANAKGGEVIERRHDAFLIPCAAGHDEPFPDYDRVRENFLVRGTDICEHVRSELIPIHSSKTPTAATMTTTATTATAVRSAAAAAAAVAPKGASAVAGGDDRMDIPRAPSS